MSLYPLCGTSEARATLSLSALMKRFWFFFFFFFFFLGRARFFWEPAKSWGWWIFFLLVWGERERERERGRQLHACMRNLSPRLTYKLPDMEGIPPAPMESPPLKQFSVVACFFGLRNQPLRVILPPTPPPPPPSPNT